MYHEMNCRSISTVILKVRLSTESKNIKQRTDVSGCILSEKRLLTVVAESDIKLQANAYLFNKGVELHTNTFVLIFCLDAGHFN